MFETTYFVRSGYEAVVSVEDSERDIVLVLGHETHEESVVSYVVCPHNDQIEQVPDPGLLDVLGHQLTYDVVGVIAVSVQERGK